MVFKIGLPGPCLGEIFTMKDDSALFRSYEPYTLGVICSSQSMREAQVVRIKSQEKTVLASTLKKRHSRRD